MRSTKRFATWMTGAVLTGALALAVPLQAHAQVSFSVGVGAYPAYGYAQPYAVPYGYDPYQNQRWEQRERWEAERAQEFQREQWQREHYEHSENRGWHGDHDRGDDWHGDHGYGWREDRH